MYMFGNPDDDINSIKTTIEYSKYLPNQLVQYSVFTPYPGTPIFEKFKDRLLTNNFQNFDQYSLVYKHDLFTKNEIRKFLEKCYTKYYLRIRWLFKYLRER